MALDLHDLLNKGYFAQELPPPFTTQTYADALAGFGAVVPPSFNGPPHFSMQYTYNLVRAGGLRRNLGIPNPKHFYRLANHIVDNWAALKTLAHTSPFSLTKPEESYGIRAIRPEHELSTRALHRASLRATSRFLLKADISRFFPSIYTHSLPWAILDKPIAKASHLAHTLSGTWVDQIDMYSRNLNNNQTIGIPIGPDTSRLLAEVLLARVDVNLKNLIPSLKGIRFIDDYEFVFASRSEAEHALGHLQHCLNEYELALNPSKTAIIELPDYYENSWVSSIRTFEFRTSISGQQNDLTSYFDMVFKLFKLHPEENMLKYAIARLNSQTIHPSNWPLCENILCHSALIEPASLPQVCDQLSHYQSLGYPIKRVLWQESLNRIVLERVPLGQVSEACWAMWLMKIIIIPLADECANAISRSDDSSTGLMALGLAHLGLANFPHLMPLSRFATTNYLYESQWLLAYQGNLNGWFGAAGSIGYLTADPCFHFFQSNNVSFFDITVPPPPPIRHTGLSYSFGGGY